MLQAEKEKLNPAFEALRNINVYEKPYQLFLKGYHEMLEEHDAYLKANDTLKTLGYETPEQINTLEKVKSDIESQQFANDVEIRNLKKDIQTCNLAMELNGHIEEKMHRLEELNMHDSIKKHETKDVLRHLER